MRMLMNFFAASSAGPPPRKRKRTIVLLSVLLLALLARRADAAARRRSQIQDNSFLIEEAYNQEPGVVQHIRTFSRATRGGDWASTFTQEWPAPNIKHQLSYTLALAQNDGDHGLRRRRAQLSLSDGSVMASRAWPISPRLTVLLPTGNENRGLGSGARRTSDAAGQHRAHAGGRRALEPRRDAHPVEPHAQHHRRQQLRVARQSPLQRARRDASGREPRTADGHDSQTHRQSRHPLVLRLPRTSCKSFPESRSPLPITAAGGRSSSTSVFEHPFADNEQVVTQRTFDSVTSSGRRVGRFPCRIACRTLFRLRALTHRDFSALRRHPDNWRKAVNQSAATLRPRRLQPISLTES